MNNPYINYYFYGKYVYLFTILLLVFLNFYNGLQSANPRKFDFFKIISYLFDILFLIFYIIGFILFMK